MTYLVGAKKPVPPLVRALAMPGAVQRSPQPRRGQAPAIIKSEKTPFYWHYASKWLGKPQRKPRGVFLDELLSLGKTVFICDSCGGLKAWVLFKQYNYKQKPWMKKVNSRCDLCNAMGVNDFWVPIDLVII